MMKQTSPLVLSYKCQKRDGNPDDFSTYRLVLILYLTVGDCSTGHWYGNIRERRISLLQPAGH